MFCNTLIENSNTLSYFDYLLENKQNPKLALFKNQRLILLSYEPKKFFDYAYLLWIKIKVFVLNIFDHVSEDEVKIENIKKEVNLYHWSKIKPTIEPHLKLCFDEYLLSCHPSQELSDLQNETEPLLQKIAQFLEKNT